RRVLLSARASQPDHFPARLEALPGQVPERERARRRRPYRPLRRPADGEPTAADSRRATHGRRSAPVELNGAALPSPEDAAMLPAKAEAPRPLPDESTHAPPGSPDKLEEMARRVARGQALWHPHDSTGPAWRRRGDSEPKSLPKVYRLVTG